MEIKLSAAKEVDTEDGWTRRLRTKLGQPRALT